MKRNVAVIHFFITTALHRCKAERIKQFKIIKKKSLVYLVFGLQVSLAHALHYLIVKTLFLKSNK